MKKIFTSLTAAALSLAVLFLPLFGCAFKSEAPYGTAPDVEETVFASESKKSPEECLEATFFLGDSNTAHLAHPSYAAIAGLVSSDRIWTGSANTLMLDIGMSVFDTKAKETKNISTIAGEKKPEYLVITLGYNGFALPVYDPERKASLDRLFCVAYKKLINDILSASPKTRVIVQSIFPVTGGTEVKSPEEVNLRIDELNGYLQDIAKECGVKYLDTQSVLRDPLTKCLRDEYSKSGSFYHADGYHLSDIGLWAVLNYIKENAYE